MTKDTDNLELNAKLQQLCRQAVFELHQQYLARAGVIEKDWKQFEIDRLKGKIILLCDLGVIPIRAKLIFSTLYDAAENAEIDDSLKDSRAWLETEMGLKL